ncbi:MAG TPA: rRNA adenine N-6-methyltransferase family protein, partial [Salinimicrobium sp.]|nr:rRNA adenine N-6-methyltransferase family protein [Salinimicrobium sp.]
MEINKKNNNSSFGGQGAVRAKKHLGQHFLGDANIAEKIADTLSFQGYDHLLEIGPGTGMLTKFLLQKEIDLHVIELDAESVIYLQQHYSQLEGKIHQNDFLKFDLQQIFKGEQFAIIGNFPYNISTQIVFKMLELREYVPEFSG